MARRGGWHRIPEADRNGVLSGDATLSGLAERISNSRSKRIVCLFGAGVSTGAGIPAFRSANGLWADPAVRSIFTADVR